MGVRSSWGGDASAPRLWQGGSPGPGGVLGEQPSARTYWPMAQGGK